jgi:hypothetical protein
MTVESLAVIAVILVMAGIFVRAGKKAVAVLCLPLISVPVFYLPARGLYNLLAISALSLPVFSLCLVFAGVVLGSTLCGALSRMIPTRKGKTGYLTFSLVFQIAISIGYVVNIL